VDPPKSAVWLTLDSDSEPALVVIKRDLSGVDLPDSAITLDGRVATGPTTFRATSIRSVR
jgi:hypothetical protein